MSTLQTSTTLLLGGHIYSPAAPDATAMAIQNGVVAWVGHDAVGRALHPDAQVVNLDGAFVAPAFVDAHVHATDAGLKLTGLDLSHCRSLADVLAAVRAYAAQEHGAVMWGHGWDETTWPEQRAPHTAELDTASGNKAVYLCRVDAHSAVASSALLARAPQARTADGWSVSGLVKRQAHHYVRAAAKELLSPAQRHAAQQDFLQYAARNGIACVHECAGPETSSWDDLTDLLSLSTQDTVPDVVGYWGQTGATEAVSSGIIRGLAGDIFVDGALGSHTAALSSPYSDNPESAGSLYLDAASIADHLIACTQAGVQAGFHAIGDRAIAEVIAGFAKAETIVGKALLAAQHHRLEHVEMVAPAQAQQLASWGVIASMQPLFDATWGGAAGMYAHRLGAACSSRLNPFAALAAAGVVLAFGSDAPVTQLNPWAAVRAAVHPHHEGNGISPRAAFVAHTRGGWRAAGYTDGLIGTLTPGAPATYAVWDVDELVIAAADSRVQRWSTDPRSRVPALPRLDNDASLPHCRQTVLRGKVIYG